VSGPQMWDCQAPMDVRARERAVGAAVAIMQRGGLVIVPSENCYLVATDAFSAKGTTALRRVKNASSDAPLGLLVASSETVSGVAARVPPAAQALMQAFWPGLVTILLKPQATLAWDHPPTAPVAVRMPIHPFTLALCQRLGPMVASVATLGGEAPTTATQALEALGSEISGVCDAGVLGGQAWSPGEDHELSSTVVDVRTRVPSIVRIGAVERERVETVLSPWMGDTVTDEQQMHDE
jgi:L-threonylcarbamoyladenylate synthase